MRKKLRQSDSAPGSGGYAMDKWDSLPWKPVDVSAMDLGSFDESMFFGLEEIDGNSYLELKNNKKTSGDKSHEKKTEESSKAEKTSRKRKIEEEEPTPESEEPQADEKQKKKKKKKSEKKESTTTIIVQKTNDQKTKKLPQSIEEIEELVTPQSTWDNVTLCSLLQKALISLDFQHPTPIQSSSVPMVLSSSEVSDVVGIAETGSGKTLAFVLPIINTILTTWNYCKSCKTPIALILSPTRELSMQISSVIKDITKALQQQYSFLRINSVNVVGGLSEEKQRRLLSTSKHPLHIVIATPGRLNEIFQDTFIEAFEDLSQIKYLVIDEADRMMEEGHFSELYRIFSRFSDHDEIVRRGESVRAVMKKRREGTSEKVEEEGNNAEEGEEDPMMMEDDDFQPLNNDENEMEDEKDVENEEEGDVEENYDDNDGDHDFGLEAVEEDELVPHTYKLKNTHQSEKNPQREEEGKEEEKDESFISFALQRQTLLFTATGLETAKNQKVLQKSFLNAKQSKKMKLKGTVKGLANDCSLPIAIKELLSVVAIQPVIRVVDVTHTTSGEVAESGSVIGDVANDDGSVGHQSITSAAKTMVALPKFLAQYELRIPTEDKDIYTYYYLLNNEGRTLIFVNSIKTARRLDGLLRALQFHCRTIHGDLPQRQRLKALETFQSSPRGILVATDIAARGLDIPKISSVIHYDIARTPQVYVHRSGRTARANQSGKTISFVTPDEFEFHQLITEYVTGKKKALNVKGYNNSSNSSTGVSSIIQNYKVEPNVLPYLRDRVQLAKKIFTLSFVLSHELKEKHWLEDQAEKTDLPIDDYLLDDMYEEDRKSSKNNKKEATPETNQQEKGKGKKEKGGKMVVEGAKHNKQKKELQALRKELQGLLETPIPSISRLNNPAIRSNKASSQSNDWRKRKVGFFVYTPPV
eukprot:gene11405-12434_t